MKKIFWGLKWGLISLFFVSLCFANWDSSTDMQVLTGSAAVSQIQASLKAIDGSSGTQPTKISVGSSGIEFEGATADAYEASITVTDPTVDGILNINFNNLTSTRTLTLPDANSVFLPTGAIFFMATGSCPSGTTDVSATYSNKFVRINATAGSTGGADTHTTPSHTLTTTEIPAHTHSLEAGGAAAIGSGEDPGDYTGSCTQTSGSTGGGGGHTHPAADNVPAYVTMKACLVD